MVGKLIQFLTNLLSSGEESKEQPKKKPDNLMEDKGIHKLYPNTGKKKKKKRRLTHENLTPDYQVTKNFTYGELLESETAREEGIENAPNDQQLRRLFKITKTVMQPIRDHLDAPVRVTSGFRTQELNEAIGGARESQHVKGEAIDFVADGYTVNEVFEEVVTGDFYFDQIIWEFGNWVHISYTTRRANRSEILTAKKNEVGETYYTKWTPQEVADGEYLN